MDIFERLKTGISTTSAEETQNLAAEWANYFPVNQVLKLSGPLGSGKTTFVQGLAAAWGVTDLVKSPSYNLYSIHSGDRQLIHLDAYRLDAPGQAEDLLIEEFLKPPFCLVVEWPEKVEGWMDDDAWKIALRIESPQTHHLQLTAWPVEVI